MNPVEEAGKMRNEILKDFPGQVDFRPNDNSFLLREIESRANDPTSRSILIGALHGDLETLFEDRALVPMNDALDGLAGRSFYPNLVALSRLDGKNAYYVPWMQATFLMAANKKALAYLPKGADLSTLSYDQLLE